MATLYFKVSSDWEQVVKLRQECEKLEAQLKKMDSRSAPAATKTLETQLASTKQQMMGLVTEAAKAGAEIENGFKKKIYDASQTVNGLSEKIIAQRAVIKDIEFDVKRLGDAYRTALKNNPIGASGKLAEYNAARKALDEEKAALFGLTQQQAEARLSVKKLRDEYSLYKKEAGETVDVTKQIKQAVTDMGKKFLGGYGIKELVSQIVRVRGEFQSMQTAIETMVGKDVASGLMTQLKEMAKISPLTLTDMVNAEKMMLGFNIQAEDTVRYLQALSDISMGDSVKFKSLTLAFSQMSAAGKLMGQDLNQMINAGFNPLQIIAEKTGKSIATLKDEMSKGAVSAEMVQQAFIDATSAGGKFYQMSENASKTINGQLSMMQDALDNAFNEMGQASEGVIMEGIQLTTTLIQNYETVGKVLVGLVATYGAYRTAVMLATIATSKHTIAEVALTNARVIARKAQLLLNAAMLTNPYVAVATVITGLVATMWALSDSTTAAEKAQERFSQKSSEMKNKEEERKKSLESLISTINDETTATVARADALNKLKSEYPDIFKKYVDEKGHITDLIELWKDYNDQASVSSRESKQRMVENIDAQIAVTQNNLNTAKANSDWGSVKKYREQLESLQKERAKWVKEVLTDVNRELSVKEEAPKTYAEDYEQARKDWEEAKKELEKIEAEKDKFTSEQYEKAKKRVESTEKAYKELGGDTKNKGIKSENSILTLQSRIDELEQRQAQDRIRQQVDLENQVAQARIDAMADGAEKASAQRELDNKKELEAIERQKEEYKQKVIQSQKEIFDAQEELKTKQNPNYKKRSFDSSSVSVDTSMFDIIYDFTQKKQVNDRTREQEQAMNRYLQEYGDYWEKRLAIADEYAQKISEAGGEDTWEGKILVRKRDEDLSELDIQAAKTTSSISKLFGDMTDKTLSELRKINEEGSAALDFLKGGEWNEEKGMSFGITQEQFNTLSKSPEMLKAISDALRENQAASDALRPSYEKVKDALNDIFNAGNNSVKLKKSLSDLQEGLNEIMQAAQFLSDTFSSLGDAFGSDALSGIAEGINVAMGALNAGMQGAQAGAMFGPIGSAAGAALGVVSSLAGAIAKIHDKKNEKRIQRLQDQIDTLTSSYDKLGRAVEDAYSKDASNLIEQQNKLLEQQKVLIEQQIREEEDKKNTDEGRIKEWRQQIEEINQTIEDNKEAAVDAIFGEDLQSAIENFADAYAEAWDNGEDKAESAKETVKKMMRQMVTESIKAAMQSSGAMEEIRNKLQQFYADNVLTGWEQDYIYNMAEELQKDLDEQFGWADSLFGSDKAKEQQSASSGGFETMTQDQTSELNGRFTALNESSLRQEAIQQGISDIADDMRNIIAQSYLELQQISENTGEIIKPIKQMQLDIAEVKRNTSRI